MFPGLVRFSFLGGLLESLLVAAGVFMPLDQLQDDDHASDAILEEFVGAVCIKSELEHMHRFGGGNELGLFGRSSFDHEAVPDRNLAHSRDLFVYHYRVAEIHLDGVDLAYLAGTHVDRDQASIEVLFNQAARVEAGGAALGSGRQLLVYFQHCHFSDVPDSRLPEGHQDDDAAQHSEDEGPGPDDLVRIILDLATDPREPEPEDEPQKQVHLEKVVEGQSASKHSHRQTGMQGEWRFEPSATNAGTVGGFGGS